MTTEYEHKLHELKLIEDPESGDHPLILQTRDDTHSADLSYALEKGHLIGEPADLALNREQLKWLRKFDGLQKKYYSKVHTVPPPIDTKQQLEKQEDENHRHQGYYQSQFLDPTAVKPGPVTDLMAGWKTAVAAGETTDSYDAWASTHHVASYLIPASVFDAMKGLIPASLAEQFKPVFEVES